MSEQPDEREARLEAMRQVDAHHRAVSAQIREIWKAFKAASMMHVDEDRRKWFLVQVAHAVRDRPEGAPSRDCMTAWADVAGREAAQGGGDGLREACLALATSYFPIHAFTHDVGSPELEWVRVALGEDVLSRLG